MAATNTPLAMINRLHARLVFADATMANYVAVKKHELVWLLNDAKHLNELNSYATERNFEDAEAALKALADYEG